MPDTTVNSTVTTQPQNAYDSGGKTLSMLISEMLVGVNSISEGIGYLKNTKVEEKTSDGGKSVSDMLSKTVSDMRQSVYDGYMAALADTHQMDAEAKEREAMLAQNTEVSRNKSGPVDVYSLLQQESPDTRRAVNSDKQVDLLRSLVEMQAKALDGKDSRNVSEKIADGLGIGGVMNWFRTSDQRKLEAEEANIARQMKHTDGMEKAAEARYKLARINGDTEGMGSALSERAGLRETRISAGKKLQSLMNPLDDQLEAKRKRRSVHALPNAGLSSPGVGSIGSLVTGIAGTVKGSPELRRQDGNISSPMISLAANVDKIRAMHETISEHTKQIHLLLMDRGDTVTTEPDSLLSKLPGLLKTAFVGLGLGTAAMTLTYAATRAKDAFTGFKVIGKSFASIFRNGISWMSDTHLGAFMKNSWAKAAGSIGKVGKPILAAATGQFAKLGDAIQAGGRAFMSLGGLAGKAIDGTRSAMGVVKSTGATAIAAGGKALNIVKGAAASTVGAFAAKHATAVARGAKLGRGLAAPGVSAAIDAGESAYYIHKGDYFSATAAGLNAAAYAIPVAGRAVGSAGEAIRIGAPMAMDAADKRLDKSRYKAQLKAQGLADDDIDKVISGKFTPESFKRDINARTLASKYGVDEALTKKFLADKESNKFSGDFKHYYSTMDKYLTAPSAAPVRTTPINSEKTDGKTQAERDASRAKMTAKELVLEFSTSPAIQSLFNRTADRSGASVGATLGG